MCRCVSTEYLHPRWNVCNSGLQQVSIEVTSKAYAMLRKLIGPFQEFGFFAGIVYGIDRTCCHLVPGARVYFYHLMVQPIVDTPLLPPRLKKNLEVRRIERGDSEIELMPARAEIKQSRFEQNATCLGVFRNRQLIGYIWFCFGSYQEDEVRCTYVLPPGDESVFDFDVYLFPEQRLGVGFPAIWDGANEYLRGRGIKFSFSRLSRFNLASKRAHDRLGWKRVARTLVFKLRELELMIATIPPYLHLSLRQSDRVRLRLCPDPLLNATGRFTNH